MADVSLSPEMREYFREYFAALGRQGGASRMAKLTPAQRKKLARKAAARSADVRRAKAAQKRKDRPS